MMRHLSPMFSSTGERPSTRAVGSGLPTPLQRDRAGPLRSGGGSRTDAVDGVFHHALILCHGTTESTMSAGTARVSAMSVLRFLPVVVMAMTVTRMAAASSDHVGPPFSAYLSSTSGKLIFSMT